MQVMDQEMAISVGETPHSVINKVRFLRLVSSNVIYVVQVMFAAAANPLAFHVDLEVDPIIEFK